MHNVRSLPRVHPDDCFIAISKKAGEGFRRCEQISPTVEYKDLRRIVIAAIRDTGQLVEETIKVFDPPRPQRSGADGLVVAEFAMTIHVCNASVDQWFDLSCRLVTGSPADNKDHTLILMEVEPCET